MKALHFKKRYKILIGFIILISALLFTAPRAGRWYIVKHGREFIGRNIYIDKIRFNYFTGSLSVYDLKLFEQDDRTVFVSFKKLKINIDYFPLLKNEILIKYILLDDPYAQVLQNRDSFNFSDMMKTDTPAVRKDSIPSKPVKYIIDNIQISRGFLTYTDKVLNHTISMNRIDLDIPGFTWNSDSTKLGLNFRFVDGGKLFSDLEVNQTDSTYALRLRLDSLNLNIIEPYVASNMYISAIHGLLTSNIRIRGDMRSIMKLSVSGMNHVSGFELLDTLGRKIFTSEEVTADIDTFLLDRNRLILNSVEFTKPSVLVEKIDTSYNWLGLMRPTPVAVADTGKASARTPAEEEYLFRFKSLKITDGTMLFADKSIKYPFSYTIDKILMTGSPDKKNPGWLYFDMKAELNKTGSFRADMAVNPDNPYEMDLSLDMSQFLMKDVEPYFKHYFAFPVTGGRLNFSSHNNMRTGYLSSNNSIYFRKFTLGKKTGEKVEYNYPLRLALGILSDKDGIIDLKAPVEMKGENIRVGNLRKIIFRTIGNLFIKAAVSPVNMIAELVKVDPDKLKEISFPLREDVPDKNNLDKVDILADILNRKPGLAINIIYCLNREKYADTLAHFMAADEYRKITGISAAVADSTLSAYLTGRMPGDTSNTATGINILCRKYYGADRLGALTDSIRDSQVAYLKQYLSRDKGIAPGRFRIIANMPDSIKYEYPFAAFRTYFEAGEESPADSTKM
jgi:hypothetical protein